MHHGRYMVSSTSYENPQHIARGKFTPWQVYPWLSTVDYHPGQTTSVQYRAVNQVLKWMSSHLSSHIRKRNRRHMCADGQA